MKSFKTFAFLVLSGFSVFTGGFLPSAVADDEIGNEQVYFSEGEDFLSVEDMDTNRGMFGITEQTSEQTLSAATTGNSLNVGGNLTNGNIFVGDNVRGFGSYVMNTGNNSTINSAVSVNVQFAPSASMP